MTTAGGTAGGGRARAVRLWTRAGYLVVLAFALLAPLTFRWDPAYLARRLSGLLSPGVLTPGDMVDAARNVLLLAGWGLLEVVTDEGRSRRRRVLGGLLTGAGIGLGAEILQLALPARSPSLLDAAMNAGGAGAGALAADASLRGLRSWRGATALGVPATALAAPYALAATLEATFPLLRAQDAAGPGGGPLTRARWALEHVEWSSLAVLPLFDVFLFAPAGVLLAAAFREAERTRHRALAWSVACGTGIAVMGELAHAPVGRPVELGPLLVHALAVAAGAAAAVRWMPAWLRRREGPERIRDFLVGYVVLLALWRLRPFVPELDPAAVARELSLSRWSPLSALGLRRDLYTVSDVLKSFLLFAPLGAALAARQRARREPGGGRDVRSVGWILGLACALEGAQAFVGERFFDGTDLAVMAAGGLVAWSFARRSSPP